MSATPATNKDTETSDLESAIRVLKTEIDGLSALADSMDSQFTQAVSAIHDMKSRRDGRLIIAGIGKSGHVARKIAATMASTGTPAFYVHPGEASHGDLGMVTQHDIVLMLSNSGENTELSDLIHYTRRHDTTLIAITSNPDSTLAKHADIKLVMPKMPEACPNGLAPTTSTTMMMALGDALAVALLERMGLTANDFKVFHPGGKLGQALVRVSEMMHGLPDLPLISPDSTMRDALIVLAEKNLGCALITGTDKQDLKGIITDGDLKRHLKNTDSDGFLDKKASDIMSTGPKTINQNALAAEAVNIMTKTPGQYITSLVVVDDDGKMTGLIRLQDCLQAGVA